MPSPTTTLRASTPCRPAMACRRSWLSGSAYFQASGAAACMAAIAFGLGPNGLSLAPSRARKGRPRPRSCASGPTKGTNGGMARTTGVRTGLGISSPWWVSDEAECGELAPHGGWQFGERLAVGRGEIGRSILGREVAPALESAPRHGPNGDQRRVEQQQTAARAVRLAPLL